MSLTRAKQLQNSPKQVFLHNTMLLTGAGNQTLIPKIYWSILNDNKQMLITKNRKD